MGKLGPDSKDEESLRELIIEVVSIGKDLTLNKPNLNAEDARLIATILCQQKVHPDGTMFGRIESELKTLAYSVALKWADSGGHIVSDLKMFELIKDSMSEEEARDYLALKEADRAQVEKGFKLALLSAMSELKSER